MNTTIKKIYADNYVPTINKLDFYLPHVTILRRNYCGKTR